MNESTPYCKDINASLVNIWVIFLELNKIILNFIWKDMFVNNQKISKEQSKQQNSKQ